MITIIGSKGQEYLKVHDYDFERDSDSERKSFLIETTLGHGLTLDKRCIPQFISALLKMYVEDEQISEYMQEAQEKFIMACKLSF